MNKMEWYPSESSPELFPAEIISGGFVQEDEKFVPLPLRQFVSNGWGKKGSTYLVGGNEKSFPIALKITWISYCERKIYSGIFGLSLEKIKLGFADGFISPLDNKKKTYNFIVVGMAPLGYISIWLNGDQISKEIDHFKCDIDKDFDISAFLGANNTLENYIQSQIRYMNPGLLKINNLFTQRFSDKWNIVFRENIEITIRIVSFLEPLSLHISFFNGESFNLFFDENKIIKVNNVPRNIYIKWSISDNDNKIAGCMFEEELIFEAISILSRGFDGFLEMVIQLSDIDGSVRVFLKNHLSFIKLK